MNTIDHPIEIYRKKNDLSQEALAKQINISTTTLHHLEKNHGQPTIRKVLKFCQRHQIDPMIFYPAE